MSDNTTVLLPTGVSAHEHLAGLHREKVDQQRNGGDSSRVSAIEAEIHKVEEFVRNYKAGEAQAVNTGPDLVDGVPVASDGTAIPEVVAAAKPYSQSTPLAAKETSTTGFRDGTVSGVASGVAPAVVPPFNPEPGTQDAVDARVDALNAVRESAPEPNAPKPVPTGKGKAKPGPGEPDDEERSSTAAATREKAVRTHRSTR